MNKTKSHKLFPDNPSTTFWEYNSQSYGNKEYGNSSYPGVTPAFIIRNCIYNYTQRNDLILDPMCGSGTSIDVAIDMGRRAIAYDLQPQRKDILFGDARQLKLPDNSIDMVFVDPPYSQHIKYSGRQECIGECHAGTDSYYLAMEAVLKEMFRVLKHNKVIALYISDSYDKDYGFIPIAFRVFSLMEKYFKAIDIVVVKRFNKKLESESFHQNAVKNSHLQRGFNYLLLAKTIKL